MTPKILASLLGLAFALTLFSGCAKRAEATSRPAAPAPENGVAFEAGRVKGHQLAGIALNAGWNAPTGQALAGLARLHGNDCGFSGADRDTWERGLISGYRDRYREARGAAW